MEMGKGMGFCIDGQKSLSVYYIDIFIIHCFSGMRFTSKGTDHIFRPVSVQAMWYAFYNIYIYIYISL